MTGPAPSSPVAALVRRHDRDRYQTALFAPRERREALFALYAFNYEVARIAEVVREPLAGRIRLQWWRDAIAEIYAGAEPRRQEVVEPLAEAIRTLGLSRARLDRLLDAREEDLSGHAPSSLAALEAYAEGTSSSLVLLAIEALGAARQPALEAGRALGIGYALAGLLAAVPFHARLGRIYLPEDLCAVNAVDLARSVSALKSSPALAMTVAGIAAQARRHLDAARALSRDVPRAALPALLPAVLAERRLDRLERQGFDVFALPLMRPDGLQSARLAWAAWRGRY